MRFVLHELAGLDEIARLPGYGEVNAVNFGSAPVGMGPTGDELYENRRAEMWGRGKDAMMDPAGMDIPDDDESETSMQPFGGAHVLVEYVVWAGRVSVAGAWIVGELVDTDCFASRVVNGWRLAIEAELERAQAELEWD